MLEMLKKRYFNRMRVHFTGLVIYGAWQEVGGDGDLSTLVVLYFHAASALCSVTGSQLLHHPGPS